MPRKATNKLPPEPSYIGLEKLLKQLLSGWGENLAKRKRPGVPGKHLNEDEIKDLDLPHPYLTLNEVELCRKVLKDIHALAQEEAAEAKKGIKVKFRGKADVG